MKYRYPCGEVSIKEVKQFLGETEPTEYLIAYCPGGTGCKYQPGHCNHRGFHYYNPDTCNEECSSLPEASACVSNKFRLAVAIVTQEETDHEPSFD